jgi:small subunit ribosomal protein S8
MPVTDPIADFLTRIRNASKARRLRVDIPSSSIKKNLAEILKNQKFIEDYSVIEDTKQNIIRIQLKYKQGTPAITGLKRISTPGLKVYKTSTDIPRVLNGLGVAVVSTSKGLLTDSEARKAAVGGEVICYIW